MRAAGTVQQFLQTPVGHWIAGDSFLVWSWSPRLRGALVWGHPSEDDFKRLWMLVDAFHAKSPGADVVTDVSQVESVDATAYVTLVEGMRNRLGLFTTRVRRHALVRSEGLLGALAEGFFPLLGARHTWQVFSATPPAFAWFDQPDGETARAEVERIANEAQQLSPELRQVRDYLKANLVGANLREMSKALGLSERSLHRLLSEQRTRFRDELAVARVDAARRLLAGTELKIEVVAKRVGCSSHAHLTTLFRRTTGQRPTEYRAQVEATRTRWQAETRH